MGFRSMKSIDTEGSRPASRYRLLDVDDKIRSTDEFLEDDGESWSRIDWNHSWNIGHHWNPTLKPMRRLLVDGASTETH